MLYDYVRQTGIYPECTTTASVQPHLTSAVKVCQSVPAVAEGWRGSPGNTSAFKSDKRSKTGAKKTRKTRLKSLISSRNGDVSQLHTNSAPKMSKIRYLFALLRSCSVHTALLVPICTERGRSDGPFIYKKHFFVFLCTLLFVHLPCEQTQESHYPDLQENLSRPLAQHHTVIREH